jgi:hypothetical protein
MVVGEWGEDSVGQRGTIIWIVQLWVTEKRRQYTVALDGHQGIIFEATTNQKKGGSIELGKGYE